MNLFSLNLFIILAVIHTANHFHDLPIGFKFLDGFAVKPAGPLAVQNALWNGYHQRHFSFGMAKSWLEGPFPGHQLSCRLAEDTHADDIYNTSRLPKMYNVTITMSACIISSSLTRNIIIKTFAILGTELDILI